MKSFARSLMVCAAAVSIAAAAIAFSAKRVPPPDPVARGIQKGGAWSKEFSKLYPVPMGKGSQPPLLGRTGDVGNTTAFEFLLNNFPKEDLPGLETWLRGKMNSDEITKVTLHGLFPDEKWPNENIKRSESIVLYADGRREELQNAKPTPVSFNGRPIPLEPKP